MSKKTILVIEDNANALRLVRRILESEGYAVIPIDNGEAGIATAKKTSVDLILCDIMMPDVSGYNVLTTLQKESIVPQVPFVFLTAMFDRQSVRHGMVLGADDYVSKPVNDEDLLATIKTILTRREIIQGISVTNKLHYDVFISYSHKDRPLMERLKDSLIKRRLRVWTDELIDPSEDWTRTIASAIKQCTCVVTILSINAASSKWVGRELAFAEENNTPIFPVVLSGDLKNILPFRLINHQYLDARTDYEIEIDKLVETLKRHMYKK